MSQEGENREKKMRGCGWKRSPSKFKLCFLLCFLIVQEAKRVLFLNFKPKFQSGWNGSSEKWGTGGGQKGKSEELNEKRAYDFPETDKISRCNIAKLQDISSFKNPKYPQKYPHSENILVDVKTACWTKDPAGCSREQRVMYKG